MSLRSVLAHAVPRIEKRDGYRLIVGGPVPRQAHAMTIGRTILVRKRHADNAALLAHELVHVRQFQELGIAGFVWRYFGSYVGLRLSGHRHMAAYRRIPLEVEASWEAHAARSSCSPAASPIAAPGVVQRPNRPLASWHRARRRLQRTVTG